MKLSFQSTHSRGVRRLDLGGFVAPMAFQSTHSRGVRQFVGSNSLYPSSDFNPRTHEECDWRPRCRTIWQTYFNPRTHEECDFRLHYYRSFCVLFQSTHSRGVRQRIISIIIQFTVNLTDNHSLIRLNNNI